MHHGLFGPANPLTLCRYLGSADAVRKNIGELKDEARGITPARDYVILSGAGGLSFNTSACL